MLFSVIDEASAVLYSKGVYKSTKLYKRSDNQYLYAGYGSGFIRLSKNDATTLVNVTVDVLDIDAKLLDKPDPLGRLLLKGN